MPPAALTRTRRTDPDPDTRLRPWSRGPQLGHASHRASADPDTIASKSAAPADHPQRPASRGSSPRQASRGLSPYQSAENGGRAAEFAPTVPAEAKQRLSCHAVIGDILQPTHLLFVLVIALLVLGPKRLPEVGRSLGKGLRDFRSALNGDESSRHEEALTPAPIETVQAAPVQAQPAAVTHEPAEHAS
jgi:sec-independent protein translocase protein TatA